MAEQHIVIQKDRYDRLLQEAAAESKGGDTTDDHPNTTPEKPDVKENAADPLERAKGPPDVGKTINHTSDPDTAQPPGIPAVNVEASRVSKAINSSSGPMRLQAKRRPRRPPTSPRKKKGPREPASTARNNKISKKKKTRKDTFVKTVNKKKSHASEWILWNKKK